MPDILRRGVSSPWIVAPRERVRFARSRKAHKENVLVVIWNFSNFDELLEVTDMFIY